MSGKKTIKIGLFLDSSPGAGAFQYCLSMTEGLRNLSSCGYQTVVVYTDPVWKKYLDEMNLKSKKVPSHNILTRILNIVNFNSLPVGLRIKLLSIFHPIPITLKKEKADLWIFPSRNEWSYLAGVPSLPVIHDLMHLYEKFPESRDGGEFERRERINKNICTRTFGVIVDSEVGKQQFQESYSIHKDRIHVLPFVPPAYIFGKPQADFREKFNVPNKYIYYPARFWPHKNHLNLIEALNMLVKEIPDIALVFTGSTDDANYSKIKEKVEQYGLEKRVNIFGYVPEEYMGDFYRNATIMVMPTFYGPTNIPPIEAMAVGCPVAVSDIYGMRDQVGNAGLLFDPNSPKNIAETIENLWNDKDLRDRLCKAGKVKVKEYDQSHFNAKLEKIIQQVLN